MMPTIKNRIETLEEKAPKQTKHVYEMIIGWGESHFEAQYFRDGERITRSEYMAEAPNEPGKIEIVWGDPIPPREADPNENDQKTN